MNPYHNMKRPELQQQAGQGDEQAKAELLRRLERRQSKQRTCRKLSRALDQ